MVTLPPAQSSKAVTLKATPNEEALKNIQDAILLHLEDRIANNEEVPGYALRNSLNI